MHCGNGALEVSRKMKGYPDAVQFFVVSAIICKSFIKFGGAVRYLGYEADWRETEDHEKGAVFIVDPSQGAPSDGFVTGWHVYTTRGRRSQVVHLQVWRPIDIHSGTGYYRYRRVGETVIAALWVGHNFFALYPVDRIPVLRGDVLGIFFPSYNPIPWTSVPCRHGNEHLLRHAVRKQDGMASEMTFEKRGRDSNPCRRYSLNATIMDEYEVLQYDYEYEDTTDGRYEKRPYGRYLPKRRFSSSPPRFVFISSNFFLFPAAISYLLAVS